MRREASDDMRDSTMIITHADVYSGLPGTSTYNK
jgi:hypothetical protein